MGTVVALVAALIVTGCYSPRAEDCAYTCNAGACPSGLYCVQAVCRDEPAKLGPCTSNSDAGRDVIPSNYSSVVLADLPTAYFRLGEMVGATQAFNEIAGAGDGAYTPSVMLGMPGALSDTSTAATFEPSTGVQCATVTSAARYDISNAASFSLEAWIHIETYLQTTTSHREIVGKLGAVGAVDSGYSLGLQWEPSAGMSRIRLRVGDGVAAQTLAGAALSLDTWHHVVATLEGTNKAVKFYVNGQNAGTGTFTVDSAAITTADFAIGCRDERGTLREGFDGSIDEVAFYRTVLSPGQVMTHFQNR
ncbi:MAG: LamG domain-containing protein [Deltaproteobacteria bacterium]|nr:LamG domain-containing protein [Deltaproteobacteria bacterium]MDQ3295382.1 LamG domain-containing protein [Myxococcota bacterium]